ncbi:uncharacterized protein C19orf18 homolog [Pipistrellus kuhlii]|uniref:Transmembrane protein n=1 Tax=Pipistrellus kuhlii TaxID=59472 RepID=A0A7J7R9I6_PIPKU|nr:uncharacterized protein C19orf18 homolog [Pipistrellus kuhlii]KAF6272733.1 hypothetical protein mPipKuh1_001717 [Pipistrellus kuhlii]
MDVPLSSFSFLVLFLLGWPLCECLPYPGSRRHDPTEPEKDASAHSLAAGPSAPEAASSPGRRAFVFVVTIACTALSLALVCGVAVSYVIYSLGRDEEREQLAALYDDIKMPLSEDEEEAVGAGRLGGAGHLLFGSQKELASFINSAIRSKRRQRLDGGESESEPTQ